MSGAGGGCREEAYRDMMEMFDEGLESAEAVAEEYLDRCDALAKKIDDPGERDKFREECRENVSRIYTNLLVALALKAQATLEKRLLDCRLKNKN